LVTTNQKDSNEIIKKLEV